MATESLASPLSETGKPTMKAEIAMPRTTAYVRMNGDAMRPMIEPGEIVEIDPDVTMFTGDGVYLIAFDTPPTPIMPRPVAQLKTLRMMDSVLMVRSENPMYGEPFPAGDNLLIGGKVHAAH